MTDDRRKPLKLGFLEPDENDDERAEFFGEELHKYDDEGNLKLDEPDE